jgi:hypothetical protein
MPQRNYEKLHPRNTANGRKARFDRTLNDALIAPRKPLTATLKRQAFQEKSRTFQEKCREGRCHPGSFLIRAR